MRESFQHEIEELLAIGNDIQNNIEAVETVEVDIYEQIMENYRKKAELAFEFHQVEIGNLPTPALIFP
jgi:RNA-splicing ligase RtcB